MAQGHLIINGIIGLLLPLAGPLILHVPGAGGVEMGFTNIVEQGGKGHALCGNFRRRSPGDNVLPGAVAVPVKQAPQGVQNVKAVLQESALAGKVKFRACRGGIEITPPDVAHELVNAGAVYLAQLRLKAGNQCLSVHCCPPSIFRLLGCNRGNQAPT